MTAVEIGARGFVAACVCDLRKQLGHDEASKYRNTEKTSRKQQTKCHECRAVAVNYRNLR